MQRSCKHLAPFTLITTTPSLQIQNMVTVFKIGQALPIPKACSPPQHPLSRALH